MTSALRVLHALLALIGVALLTILVVVLFIPVDTALHATRLDQSSLCTEAPVDTAYSRAALSALLSRAPPAQCPAVVSLPYKSTSSELQLRRHNVAPMGLAWYLVHYDVPVGWKDSDRLMIYVPRVMGVAWQARVNNQFIFDDLDDWRMTWNHPIAPNLASAHFRPGETLDVAIGVVFEPWVGHSLARISIGPSSILGPRLAIRQFLQFVMPVACSVTLLAMGVFFLVFWGSRRTERTHLYLALSCIAWCVCNLQFVLPRRDDATLDAWYGAVTGPAITWVMWLIYLFVLQLDERFSRLIAIGMPPFVLIMSIIALPVIPLNEYAGLFYQGANVAVALLVAGRIVWMAVKGGVELRVISAALALASIAGAHDLGLLSRSIDPEGIYLTPYSSMLLFGAFLFTVQRRYVHAINQHEQLTSHLAERLSEREAELQGG